MSVKEAAAKTDETEEGGKGGKKKLLIIAVAVLVAAAAVWWFMIRPAGAEEAAPKPGEVMQLEPIQINLAGGRYLKIGVALQAIEGAHEIEGSKALDATIELFSGRSVEELADAEEREKLKTYLLEELEERYHDEIMEVYFTDFVTQ